MAGRGPMCFRDGGYSIPRTCVRKTEPSGRRNSSGSPTRTVRYSFSLSPGNAMTPRPVIVQTDSTVNRCLGMTLLRRFGNRLTLLDCPLCKVPGQSEAPSPQSSRLCQCPGQPYQEAIPFHDAICPPLAIRVKDLMRGTDWVHI